MTAHPHDPVKVSETWLVAENERLAGVHLADDCEAPCPIHHPSEHVMRGFRLHWRNDRQIFERICPHGVGHPDPDHLSFIERMRDEHAADVESVHGCDGCCREPRP